MRQVRTIIGTAAAIAGILALGITIGYFVCDAQTVEKLCVPDLTITALEVDGDQVTDFEHEIRVPCRIAVCGESEDLPNDDDLSIWICVMPPNGRYYAQREPIEWQGKWELSNIGVGKEGSDDVGKQFSICAVAAEEKATECLFSDAAVYHRGLPSLPDGAVICDQIVVIREDESSWS